MFTIIRIFKTLFEDVSSTVNLFFVFVIFGLYQRQVDMIKENSVLTEKLVNAQDAITQLSTLQKQHSLELLMVELKTKQTGASIVNLGHDANLFYNNLALIFGVSAFFFLIYIVMFPSNDEKLKLLYEKLHESISHQNGVIVENDNKLIQLLSDSLENQSAVSSELLSKLDGLHSILSEVHFKSGADGVNTGSNVEQFASSLSETVTPLIQSAFNF